MKKRKRTEPDIDDGQKITGPDVFSVILQEDGPGLRGRFGWANLGDVGLNGVFGNRDTEFEEFAANAFSTPQSVFLCHLLDESDGLDG